MPRPRTFDDTEVIEAAMHAFWDRGYEATSADELCRRTGLGRGSLYNAFGTKQSLYEEAVRRYADITFQNLLTALERPGPLKERLRAFMYGVIDTDVVDADHRGCLVVNAAVEVSPRNEGVREIIRRQSARMETTLCGVLVIAQRAGEVSADTDPLRATRTILTVLNGLRVLGKVATERDALTDAVDGVLATL
ncbi:TetR/AcrR family transcriptional regulator [Streptomyces sp. CA-132043]|uniref:TetR/AcrR family transcriptional regulator n=1 Tax=Streptomyces sp. CA-132043 TaxID=3240048 RepID=UPI003D8F8F0C